jgi:hypothetical protein
MRDGNKTIARTDVFRVRYARAGHPVLCGTIIGAAVGVLSLWATERGSKHPQNDEAVGIGILLGAPAGAIVGTALPHGAPLYQAVTRSTLPARR